MKRSKLHVLVPYCALSQGVRADTIVRQYPAVVTEVIECLMQHNINIIQMPCPELFFDGIRRKPCGKPHYDTPYNRKICREVATKVVDLILLIQSGGYEVIGILGVNYSPSCAVDFLRYTNSEKISGTGIYIEELQSVLHKNNLKIPFIGVENYHIDNTVKQLNRLISSKVNRQTAEDQGGDSREELEHSSN
jgi:predicted secreted protein